MEYEMALSLPAPVTEYLAADKAKDPDRVARCFIEDALVHDENTDYRGIAAIRAWKQSTNAKYAYVVEPLAASVSGQTVKLRARLTGTFPGSPVELDYTFTLADGRIAVLEID
jgi:ketosteroid isomerase-like protein